jgi:hypothetical protein
MGDLMRVKMLVAWAMLGCAPVLLGATPADAASTRDRRETHRTTEAAPARHAPANHAPAQRSGNVAPQRGAAAASQRTAHVSPQRTAPAPAGHTASRLPRLVGSAQASMAAPIRGQLAVTRDRHAAVSNAQSCRTGSRRTCVRGPAMSWTRGLEPAVGVQASECPDGTMATPARGHDNITRCMPI